MEDISQLDLFSKVRRGETNGAGEKGIVPRWRGNEKQLLTQRVDHLLHPQPDVLLLVFGRMPDRKTGAVYVIFLLLSGCPGWRLGKG